MRVSIKLLGTLSLAWLVLTACAATSMTEAEQDARMAECQLINDDDERRVCLERLALGDEVDVPPPPPINRVNY